MLIKHHALSLSLKHTLHPLYVLMGNCSYLLNESSLQIKKAWRKLGSTDETTLHLNNTSDWNQLIEEANCFSLFSDHRLIHAYLEKKSMEKSGRECLETYLNRSNAHCLIILSTSQVPLKQLQWLSSCNNAMLVQNTTLSASQLLRWITEQLRHNNLAFESDVPNLICQYTQGNMLATAQLIEKIVLTYNQTQVLTSEEIHTHLIDQSNYSLYELVDACLASQASKAIRLIRHALDEKQEPTLILWMLTHEIRRMIRLTELTQQTKSLISACNQENVWKNRIQLYQHALSYLTLPRLYQLIQYCAKLDQQIKSNQNYNTWQNLERLVLALSLPGFDL